MKETTFVVPSSWPSSRALRAVAVTALVLLAACGRPRTPDEGAPVAGPSTSGAQLAAGAPSANATQPAAGTGSPPGAERPGAVAGKAPAFRPIEGFDAAVNDRIASFLKAEEARPGRKVAVFDGDGTTIGQAPHYLADECLYQLAAREPTRKREIIDRMRKVSNVSIPYVQDRVHFFAGLSVEALRELGDRCFHEHYAGKIYPAMRALIGQLQEHGFEVWVITGSPEVLYQQFLSRELGIPLTNVVGVRSVIRGGIVTDEIIHPVPQDAGKREAIETFVQARPLIAGGNSRGDREMIEHSTGLRIIVNPDEHVAEGDTESMAAYAARQGWLVVRQHDAAEPSFPAITSRQFGVRTNKSHPLP